MDKNYLSPHCRSGNCNWCRERRARALRKETEKNQLKADASNYKHWETKTGANLDIIGYWPPGGWGPGFKTDGPRRLHQFVKKDTDAADVLKKFETDTKGYQNES